MHDLHEEAGRLLSDWATRFNAAEIAPLISLYARDTILLGTSSPELYAGRDMLDHYFRLGAHVTIGAFEVRELAGGAILCAGFYEFARENGATVRVNPARFTFVFGREDGAWRILHHHSSALPPPRA